MSESLGEWIQERGAQIWGWSIAAAFMVGVLEFMFWLISGEWRSMGLIDLLSLAYVEDCAQHELTRVLVCQEQIAQVLGDSLLPHFERTARGWIGAARLLDWIVDYFAFTNAIFTVPMAGFLTFVGMAAVGSAIDAG